MINPVLKSKDVSFNPVFEPTGPEISCQVHPDPFPLRNGLEASVGVLRG